MTCVPDADTPCGPWVISEDVTLLPPGSPDGIEVYTEVGAYATARGDPNRDGLKSFAQLRSEGAITEENTKERNEWRAVNSAHDHKIFFRAPFRPGRRFEEWFPGKNLRPWNGRGRQVITVLVDPARTYIYTSDIRSNWIGTPTALKRVQNRLATSRILLADYLSGRATSEGAATNKEIVVQAPRIGPRWFVRSGVQFGPPPLGPPIGRYAASQTELNTMVGGRRLTKRRRHGRKRSSRKTLRLP